MEKVPLPHQPEGPTKVPKAYKNMDFLNSRAARPIRIMCEFEETRERLRTNHITGTLLIFGSARSLSPDQHATEIKQLEQELAATTDAEQLKKLQTKKDRLERTRWMCDYYHKAEELGHRLTEWAVRTDVRTGVVLNVTPGRYIAEESKTHFDTPEEYPQQIVVCTGGGPGIMEAANKGASQVGRSMGMGISLPFEGLNQYLDPALAFEFHYFFTRKFWMVYQARCIVVFPGGFGTFDELFEACTLKQTGKLMPDVPIVLMGKQYWQKVVNWQALVDLGTIAQQDLDDMFFTDEVEEAYTYIVGKLQKTAPQAATSV